MKNPMRMAGQELIHNFGVYNPKIGKRVVSAEVVQWLLNNEKDDEAVEGLAFVNALVRGMHRCGS